MNRVLLLLLAAVPFALCASCPPNTEWLDALNSCILVDQSLKNYTSAAQQCQANGGSLCSVHNAFENKVISVEALQYFFSSFFFLGARRHADDTWTWDDNTAFNYTSWASNGQSAGDCLAQHVRDGSWYAVQCDVALQSICKVPPRL